MNFNLCNNYFYTSISGLFSTASNTLKGGLTTQKSVALARSIFGSLMKPETRSILKKAVIVTGAFYVLKICITAGRGIYAVAKPVLELNKIVNEFKRQADVKSTEHEKKNQSPHTIIADLCRYSDLLEMRKSLLGLTKTSLKGYVEDGVISSALNILDTVCDNAINRYNLVSSIHAQCLFELLPPTEDNTKDLIISISMARNTNYDSILKSICIFNCLNPCIRNYAVNLLKLTSNLTHEDDDLGLKLDKDLGAIIVGINTHVPLQDRAAFLDFLSSFAANCSNIDDIFELLMAFKEINPVERISISDDVKFLTDKIVGETGEIAELFEIMSEISQPVRKNLLSTYGPRLSSILDMTDIGAKWEQFSFLLTSLPLMKDLSPEALAWIEKNNFLFKILDIHDFWIKEEVVDQIIKAAKNDTIRTDFSKLQPNTRADAIFANLVLCNVEHQISAVSSTGTTSSIRALVNHKGFKDEIKQNILLRILCELDENEDLTAETKANILNQFSKCTTPESLINQGRAFLTITEYKGINSLNGKPIPAKFDETLKDLFKNCFNLQLFPGFDERYARLSTDSRIPYAFQIYGASLISLQSAYPNDLEVQRCVNAYTEFLKSVMNDEFPKIRYQTTANPHLAKLDPSLLQDWQKCQESLLEVSTIAPVDEIVKVSPVVELKTILKESIIHHAHLPTGQIEYLVGYLSASNDEIQKTFTLKLGQQLRNKSLTDQEKNILLLQNYCIKLVTNPREMVKNLQAIEQILAKLDSVSFPYSDFVDDLQKIKEMSAPSDKVQIKDKYAGYKVVITDDVIDLIHYGTEVRSCQAIDGTPENNKCLLAVLKDGKNRVVAVKNNENKIVARALIRILFDQATDAPVLFLDLIYPQNIVPQHKEAVLDMAEREAKRLGIPLKLADKSRPSYDGALVSGEGSVPFEYCDSGYRQANAPAIFPKGIYTVK